MGLVMPFVVFVSIGFLGTFLLTPFLGPLVAAIAGWISALLILDGGVPARTPVAFMLPLTGVLIGIVAQFYWVPVDTGVLLLVLGGSAVNYTLANALTLKMSSQGRRY